MGTQPDVRFVTASLKVDYLRPTPIDTVLELRGRVKSITPRKVVVEINLNAKGQITAKGEVIAVMVPENMF